MLRWNAAGGAAAVEILRSPGIAGAPTSVVFRGAGDGFVDSQVVNGNRYAYEVRVGRRGGQRWQPDRARMTGPAVDRPGGRCSRQGP